MPARECALDNRTINTDGDLGATAFDTPTYWLADRAVSIALTATSRAPHVRISIRVYRFAFMNPAKPIIPEPVRLTMRLSDARLRRHPTKLLYPDHRLPPWPTEDDTRDRSNRLLDDCANGRSITRPAWRRGAPELREELAPRNAG